MKKLRLFDAVLEFSNLLVAALLVGAMFGLWLSLNPSGLDAATYIGQQQLSIRALNVPMPLLGGLTLLLTIIAAVFARSDRPRFAILVVAAICLLAAGLITRFLNQPINAIVINWSVNAPPPEWMQLRDSWWQWHIARLGFGICALSLLIAATMKRGRSSVSTTG